MNELSPVIAMAGLMPHAPVLVPAVGGGRGNDVAESVSSMRELSRRALAFRPRRLVLISPHSPRRSGAFGIWETSRLEGSLQQFGCPEVGLSLPNDTALLVEIRREATARGLSLWGIFDRPLDHGAVVPLYFLVEAGWSGPTMVLSLNYPGEGGLEDLGASIRQAVLRVGGPAAIIASGDMSHRLKRGAPAGYHPDGKRFDETFVSLLRKGRYAELKRLDPGLLDLAAEDVVDSTRVALGAVGYEDVRHEVLSYEGPFGVGYCVAMLYQCDEEND